MSSIKVRWFGNIPARYRDGTTDEKVLREVVDRAGYKRQSMGFDVESGEHWLDLGSNIGAFAIYCKIKGATADCFEPDKECFQLLKRNAEGFDCFQTAVTSFKTDKIQFWKSRNPENHYRGSIVKNGAMLPSGEVPNLWIGSLSGDYDGVKMDIEGSEFGIIDSKLVPQCDKLCMEYHTSRDPSMSNLKKRLDYLKSLFRNVSYPPEYDRRIAEGGNSKTYFDRFIYCQGRR